MKVCPKCGSQFKDNLLYCVCCHIPLKDETNNSPYSFKIVERNEEEQEEKPLKKKGSINLLFVDYAFCACILSCFAPFIGIVLGTISITTSLCNKKISKRKKAIYTVLSSISILISCFISYLYLVYLGLFKFPVPLEPYGI